MNSSSLSSKKAKWGISLVVLVLFVSCVYIIAQKREDKEEAQFVRPPKSAPFLVVKDEAGVVVLTNSEVASAKVDTHRPGGEPQILLTLTPTGKTLFAQVTQKNVGKPLSFYFKGQLLTRPIPVSVITDGLFILTGNFSLQQAQDVAAEINHN